MSRLFKIYGEFCANHPWEVIVAVITLTTCLFTIEQNQQKLPAPSPCPGCFEEQFKAIDVVIMTIIRCLAILYTSHQFRNLQKMGSKYILGIAGLFTVFSSFVFTTTVLNFLRIDLVDLKDALFFFLLLIDLSKAATLAQFALTASSQEEISSKIARGMSILGPTITLDTVVETLVIGVGTLSGVHRLEMLSYFAVFSVLVNYLIFMTFYPACLSLMLELSKIKDFYGENRNKITRLLLEENEKSNPAVERVKIIMSMGLMVVHVQSRWFIDDENKDMRPQLNITSQCDDSSLYGYLMKQFVFSADHIVILITLLTLIVKFVFLENDNIYNVQETRKNKKDNALVNKEVQTIIRQRVTDRDGDDDDNKMVIDGVESGSVRKLEQCLEIFRSELGATKLTDDEIMLLVDTKHIPFYNLEKVLNDHERGVKIRRKIVGNYFDNTTAVLDLPYKNYDYSKVMGVCCENVIGYIPVPLGIAGPLYLDGKKYYVPMSTTEGCLIASTNRGCRAVETCGIKSRVTADGMTRAPVVRLPSISKAGNLIAWLNKLENFEIIKEQFDSTSRFAKLIKVSTRMAARYVYIRFVAETGDAMGMNMLSKGTEKALKRLQIEFPEMEIISISGNYCTDKKPSSVNWIEGRGKSVACETTIPASVVKTLLKTTSRTLVDLNINKNLIGSAIAGSIGGFNAHAANIVTAIFIATGQDPAQNIGSSNCITIMETSGENNEDLYVSCTMPSMEIGTIGGGTNLPAQSACLEILGVKGSTYCPGENAKQLARIICATVLVGELSLMAALATGHLVKSHLKYNRSYADNISCEQ